jgi:hypothetical protein
MRKDLEEALEAAGEDVEEMRKERGPEESPGGPSQYASGFSEEWTAYVARLVADEYGFKSAKRFLGEFVRSQNAAVTMYGHIGRTWMRTDPTLRDVQRALSDFVRKLRNTGRLDWMLDDDPDHIRTSLRISRDLHRLCRIRAAERGLNLSDTIVEIVAERFAPEVAVLEDKAARRKEARP